MAETFYKEAGETTGRFPALRALAFVTGAGGFIGRHLVRHLATTGTRVAGLDLISAEADQARATCGWQTGALSLTGLDALMEEIGVPDTVYHLAGGSSVGASLGNPYDDFSATVGGTGILLNWLRLKAPQARLVLVSSAAVYGNLHPGDITEDAATAPFSPYGAHKFAMEVICRGWAGSFSLNVVAVRLFSVYGSGLAKQLLWDLCRKLATDAETVTLGGTGEELRDWTHVDDVIRALVAAAPFASSAMPIINAGSGRAVSVCRIAEIVARSFGRTPSCLQFSGQSRVGDPFSLIAGPGLLTEAGFRWEVEVNTGVADYVRWFKAEAHA